MPFRKVDLLSEFQELEHCLVPLLPKSSQMINLIRLAIHSKFPTNSSNDFYIFKDDTSLGTPIKALDPCKLFLVCIQVPNIFSTHCIISLTPDAADVTPSMVDAFDTLVDWGSVHLFSQTNATFGPHLEKLCRKHGNTSHITKYDGRLFTLDPVLALDYVPPGDNSLKIRPLQESHATQVIADWKMAQPHSYRPVVDAISCFPSVGIFDDTAGLVSSAITSTMSLINVVFTVEGWRRQGLGEITVKTLAKKISQCGLIPCAEIERNNASSEGMLVKAGFLPVLDTVWLYFKGGEH